MSETGEISYLLTENNVQNKIVYEFLLLSLWKLIVHKKEKTTYIVFMDNARYHMSNSIKNLSESLGIYFLFNVPNCP